MDNQASVCFTFDAACDAAIDMEAQIYRSFLNAIRLVKDRAANEILIDAAMLRLDIKTQLELAALRGGFEGETAHGPVPTMNLKIRCCDAHQINARDDNRKALAYAIELSKDALQFYRHMAEQCSGAPMAKLFIILGDGQTRHLQSLEDLYVDHFLTEG